MHSTGQQWLYRSGMRLEHALLFTIFDRKKDGRAWQLPYSTFEDPAIEECDLQTSETIKIRALVFHTTDRD
ncbi:hypothetical protein V2A60_005884 [Cordyceps javanica]|nr:hypothetical protein IF2G_06159 [Cordyceps javanica]